jgi:hypothetical protein
VLDGILFEKHGVPSVAVVTDEFVETGRAMAQAWGISNYSFLSMPHPTANLTGEEMDQRAREIAPKIAQFLLQRKGKGK